MRHLHGRILGGLLGKQGGINDVYFVIGVESTSHKCKSRLTTNQSYLDIDAVDEEFILQKGIHYVAVDDAGLSGGYGKEIQLALDPFARLSMY